MTWGGMRTVTNAPRHPREVRERMEAEGDMIPLTGEQALLRLIHDCRFPEPKARRLLNIAWEFGQKAEPYPGGYVHIWYHGQEEADHIFSVIEHFGNSQPGKVAPENAPRYNQTRTKTPRRITGTAESSEPKGTTAMPPTKRTRQAAAPEPEPTDEVDFTKYVSKDFSPTMKDYVEWFEQNVASLDDLEVDRILVLGVGMYSHFQKSAFNIQRREERRAERAQTGDAQEPATPPARTRTGSGPAKPAPARTGRAGAASSRAAGNGKAPARSTKATKTRAAAGAAAAGGDAPF